MTIFGALNVALTSVKTLGQSVTVLSDNISNATDETYNRRQVATSPLEFGGVRIDDITRSVNTGLRTASFAANSASEEWRTKQQFADTFEALLGTLNGATPLSDRVENFQEAWRSFQATPEVQGVEYNVTARADSLVSEVARLSEGLDRIETQINREIQDDLVTFNNAISEVNRLNQRIAIEAGGNRPISQLENLVEKQLDIISGLVSFSVRRNQNHSYNIIGQNFSLTSIPTLTLSYNDTSQTLSRVVNSADNVRDQVPGGRLEALLNLVSRDQTKINSADRSQGFVGKLRSQLDEITRTFTDDFVSKVRLQPVVGRTDNQTRGNIVSAQAGLSAGTFDVTLSATTGVATTTSVTISATTNASQLVEIFNGTGAAAQPGIAGITARTNGQGQLELFSATGIITIADGAIPTGLLGSAATNSTPLFENSPSFANVYNNAAQRPGANEVAGNFFQTISSGTEVDRANFQVNPSLRNRIGALKRSSADSIVTAFNSSSRTLSTPGFGLQSVRYIDTVTGLTNDILVSGRRVEEQSTLETEIRTQVRTQYRNLVGVNIDNEVARLTILQNNYNASARVISAANNMLQALEQIVGR